MAAPLAFVGGETVSAAVGNATSSAQSVWMNRLERLSPALHIESRSIQKKPLYARVRSCER